MKFHLHYLIFLFLCIELSSCSSTLETRTRIQSNPSNAEVFVSQQNSTDKKSLGKTPLSLNYRDLTEKAGGAPNSGEFLILSFELKDHETEKLLFPAQPFGTTKTEVLVKMTPSKDLSLAKDILTRLHNAQKFALNQQYERALIETDKVLEIDPTVIRALSMKGSIYYVQKNYAEAIKWFEKALAVDNTFDEAIRMINKIKEESTKDSTTSKSK